MSKKLTPPISGIARENYASLDGLRAYAAIGIVMMHVQANIAVKPSVNVLTEKVIPWFTDFTLLFMVISAFSMCCGYYDKVKNGEITPAKFYAKRYHRTWPFLCHDGYDCVCDGTILEYVLSKFCRLDDVL